MKEFDVVPKSFPKKKQTARTYDKSSVAIAKKKIKTTKTDWTAKSLIRLCVKQKKRSQLSSERMIKKRMEVEKVEKRKRTANVNKVSSGKKLNKKKNLNLNVRGGPASDVTKKRTRLFAYRREGGGVCSKFNC